MACYNSVIVILTINLLVIICGAQIYNEDPVNADKKILKQPPHNWGTPSPDSGLKLDFVPFRMLASVRHEESTQHLPREAAVASASTPEEIILAKRLRESITVKKLGEVYTEQGYEDQKYDHGYFEKHGDYKEKYEKHDKSKTDSKKPIIDFDASSSNTNKKESPKYYPRYYPKYVAPSSITKENLNKKSFEPQYNNKKYPYYKTAPKNSPLRYALNPELVPNKKTSEMPFYESTNYKDCPEITPVLDVGPDSKGPKGEPRLKGLGDKIDCLKSKYFGIDPFDNPFFKEEDISAVVNNEKLSKIILPSESKTQPVLYLTNKTSSNKPQKLKVKAENTRLSVKKAVTESNVRPAFSVIGQPVASTEFIEGMLPPPLPKQHRHVRDLTPRNVYSTRRGGVRFASLDLEGDGSEIDAARIVSSHRVTAGNKYGARETGESRRAPSTRDSPPRSRTRGYEVTELPEEPIFATNNRFVSRSSPPRRVQVEHHRATKEETFSSTYIPHASVEEGEVTTTVWNAAPPTFDAAPPPNNIDGEINSIEPQFKEVTTDLPKQDLPTTFRSRDSGRSRTRGRPPVALISEDVFQGRGERRKSETPGRTNSELLRSRNRNNHIKNLDDISPVPETSFSVPEIITTTTESEPVIIPTENIPSKYNPSTESSYDYPTEHIPIHNMPTEKIPVANSIRSRRPSTERFEAPTEKIPSGSRHRSTGRRQRPTSAPVENSQPSETSESTRVPTSRQRTSRRNEPYRARAASPVPTREEPETSRPSPRSRGSPRASIDPVENVDLQADTRRVNRQGSSRSRSYDTPASTKQEVQVDAPVRSRTSSRRAPAATTETAAPQTEVTSSSAASTRRGSRRRVENHREE